MRNIWIIARREYKLYFASPAAYMIAFMILAVLGVLFFINIQAASAYQGSYVPGVSITLGPLATLLMLATPAITTRLLAEEQRMGTIELLLTAPVRDWELVVGKWLGAWLFLLTVVSVTIIYPLILNRLVSPGIDQGPVISGYLGIFLMTAAMVAIGVAVSSFFNNQIATFATTMGVLVFFWWIISPISQVMGQTSPAADWISYLDLADHFFSNLMVGIVDARDILYYLSLTALALFAGTMSVETRRWR